MKTILLHLERLRRHYEAAVKTYDEVSLLDLSHTLRLWTELKKPLENLAPEFSNSRLFRTGIPAKKGFKGSPWAPVRLFVYARRCQDLR